MAGRKRLGALLLCIGLILVLSVSTAFMIHEADHDCTGEDCPVCRNIAIHIRLLRTIGLAALILPAFFSLPAVYTAFGRRDRYACFGPETLVSWKIRLND